MKNVYTTLFCILCIMHAQAQDARIKKLQQQLRAITVDTALVDGYNNLNRACLALGDIHLAKIYADSAIALSEKIKYIYGETEGYRTKGYYFLYTNDSANALLSFNKSYELATQIKNAYQQQMALASKGFLYFNYARYDMVYKYL